MSALTLHNGCWQRKYPPLRLRCMYGPPRCRLHALTTALRFLPNGCVVNSVVSHGDPSLILWHLRHALHRHVRSRCRCRRLSATIPHYLSPPVLDANTQCDNVSYIQPAIESGSGIRRDRPMPSIWVRSGTGSRTAKGDGDIPFRRTKMQVQFQLPQLPLLRFELQR
jgi:hypothetical protein